jgi:hypothetical protein
MFTESMLAKSTWYRLPVTMPPITSEKKSQPPTELHLRLQPKLVRSHRLREKAMNVTVVDRCNTFSANFKACRHIRNGR